MKFLVINGPNLQLLGRREPEIYGHATLADLEKMIQRKAEELGVQVEMRQSNHQGVLLDWIGEAPEKFDGIVLNPGAYAHTSLAIHDAILGVALPTVEVHITNVAAREQIRQYSLTASACIGQISGLGLESYLLALQYLAGYCANKE